MTRALRVTSDVHADRDLFDRAGVTVPRYDIEEMRRRTADTPRWLHLGPGNFFRALHAQVAHDLLDRGAMETGVVAAGVRSRGVITEVYRPALNRHLTVVMAADGGLRTQLVASVAESYSASVDVPEDWAALRAVAAHPRLQLVTLTITEKGYALTDGDGEWLPQVAAEIADGPARPRSAIGVLTALLAERFAAGAPPVAMASTDNFSRNGDRLRAAVLTMATAWLDRGAVDPGFVDYLSDPAMVSFPLSMVDRITPNPAPAVAAMLAADGIAGVQPVRVSDSTVMASFSNTEEVWYWVLEDDFPNGRPPLELAGVRMTDRDTVNDADELKVTTCLNPLHTALAIFGVLLGVDTISAAMRDADLRALAEGVGYREGLPVAADPGIIEPRAFLDEVVDRRLPNPHLPDSPRRIIADTSQKLPIRFGVTLRKYLDSPTLDAAALELIPLTLAAWVRYLLGVDDAGRPVELGPDPMLASLTARLSGLRLGGEDTGAAELAVPLLSEVLDVPLALTPLAAKITAYVRQLSCAPGAVRDTLHTVAARHGGRG